MENINAIIFLGASAFVLICTAIWLSPDALEHCILRLRMRRAYILAGRDAAQEELHKFELTA